MTSRATCAVIFAFAHLFIICALFFVLLVIGISRFDHGGQPTSLEQIATGLLAMLSAPIVALAYFSPIRIPVLIQFGLLLINSALWGFGLSAFLTRLRGGNTSS